MTPVEQLRTAFAVLNLKAIDARLEGLLETASKKERSYAYFLLEVMNTEADARWQRDLKARLQLAHLVYAKTFSQSDFSFHPPIENRRIRKLRTLRFVHEASNAILLDPPGAGKAHIVVSLGETAIQSGCGAYFMTAEVPADRFCAPTRHAAFGPPPLSFTRKRVAWRMTKLSPPTLQCVRFNLQPRETSASDTPASRR